MFNYFLKKGLRGINIVGPSATLGRPNSGWGRGARAHPKVYKSTPVKTPQVIG